MKKIILILFLVPILNFSFCQEIQKKDSLIDLLETPLYKNLLSGIIVSEDSMIKGSEYFKVFSDSEYRKIIYPRKYTWEQVKYFVKKQEVLQALWLMINLYEGEDKNKEKVINSLLMYDKLFDVEKPLINSFYTYAYLDPEVSEIKGGKYTINRPDILESKQRRVQEIVKYIKYYKDTHKLNTEKQVPLN